MKYILNKDSRLRGWTDSLANLECYPSRALFELTPKECLCLMKCDGEREMDTETFQAELMRYSRRLLWETARSQHPLLSLLP